MKEEEFELWFYKKKMKKERTDELFAMRSSTERLKILFFLLTSSGSCYRPLFSYFVVIVVQKITSTAKA